MEYTPTRRTVLTSSGLLTAGLAGCVGAAQENGDQEGPEPVDLGTACEFSILAKSGISTVPDSDIAGDIGVSPIASTAITGFDLTLDATGVFATSTQVGGRVYAANYTEPTPSRLTTAVSDFEAAYTDAFGRDSDFTNVGGGSLSGDTLTPGVYSWDTDLSIDDDITIDGGPDDTFIFQVSGDLTVASGVTVDLEGGVQAENIVWVVAGGAGVEIGTDAEFAGIVLTQTGINVLTDATVDGCLYAQTDVNLQMATVTGCDCDLVDLQVSSECVDGDGEITVTNPNDSSVMVTITGPDGFEETIEVPAEGSETLESLADGTYSLETDDSEIGLDITTLDISCDPDIPDVITTPATDVDESSATLNGELTDLGEFDEVDVFFEWREVGTDEWNTTDTQTLGEPGGFDAEIEGLEPDTTYEFRAVGVADGERVEGAILLVIIGDGMDDDDDDDEDMDDEDDDDMDDDEDMDDEDDDDDDDDDDDKKKPDVEDDVDLKLVSKKKGDKYKFKIYNDTEHDIKFSWGLDDSKHGGKVTVDGESSDTFHVEGDEEGTVYLYHDGEEVDSVDID
ncbi:MAG: ice-binding family protein [Euryarchaeota archaeon]|nr:ice-binding family protein [Euryarchaeota archaeon]